MGQFAAGNPFAQQFDDRFDSVNRLGVKWYEHTASAAREGVYYQR